MTTATFIRPTADRAFPADRREIARPGAPVFGGGPADGYRRAHRVSPPTVQPNYALRRILAAAAVVVCSLAAVSMVAGVVASLGGAPAVAAADSASPAAVPTRHVAQSGDTLWSIATAYRGPVDHDRFLEALIRLNGGTTIEVGQAVLLP